MLTVPTLGPKQVSNSSHKKVIQVSNKYELEVNVVEIFTVRGTKASKDHTKVDF